MADVHDAATRSRNMAAIRRENTKPERILRSGLHRLGFRFRLQAAHLPGRPDLVLARYRAVIFAQGCFWHGHGCPLFRWPASRQEFWRQKITGNMARDAASCAALEAAGWRIALVWECALKGRGRLPQSEVMQRLADWLRSDQPRLDLAGKPPEA